MKEYIVTALAQAYIKVKAKTPEEAKKQAYETSSELWEIDNVDTDEFDQEMTIEEC